MRFRAGILGFCDNPRHPHSNVMFEADCVQLLAGYSGFLVRIGSLVLWSHAHGSFQAG